MEEEEGQEGGGYFPRELCVGGACYTCSLCARVRVFGVQEEVQALCVCAVPLCLQGDKYSSRSYNQGRENEEISTG